MVAVDTSNNRAGTEEFYELGGFEIPAAFDADSVAVSRYRIAGTPTHYILDEGGTIIWRHFGYLPGQEVALRSRLRAWLSPSES